MDLNPLHWQPNHRVGFIFAAAFGASIGVFAGLKDYGPYVMDRWLWIGLYGLAGLLLGAAGGLLRQWLRGKDSNRNPD